MTPGRPPNSTDYQEKRGYRICIVRPDQERLAWGFIFQRGRLREKSRRGATLDDVGAQVGGGGGIGTYGSDGRPAGCSRTNDGGRRYWRWLFNYASCIGIQRQKPPVRQGQLLYISSLPARPCYAVLCCTVLCCATGVLFGSGCSRARCQVAAEKCRKGRFVFALVVPKVAMHLSAAVVDWYAIS